MVGFSKLSQAARWPVLGASAIAVHALVLGVGLLGTSSARQPALPERLEVSLLATDTAAETAAETQTPRQGDDSEAAPSHASSKPAAPRREHQSHLPTKLARGQVVHTPVLPRDTSAAPSPAVLADKLTSAVGAAAAVSVDSGSLSSSGTGRAGSGVESGDPAAREPHGAGLATKPRLLSAASACHGVLSQAVFGAPSKVTIVVRVGTDGVAAPTEVRTDGHGDSRRLSRAAQECTKRLRFSPARNARGEQVTASSVLRLTISNHYSAHVPAAPARREGHI